MFRIINARIIYYTCIIHININRKLTKKALQYQPVPVAPDLVAATPVPVLAPAPKRKATDDQTAKSAKLIKVSASSISARTGSRVPKSYLLNCSSLLYFLIQLKQFFFLLINKSIVSIIIIFSYQNSYFFYYLKMCE